MNKRFYKLERKYAEALFGFIELVLVALLVERAVAGSWKAAVIFAVIAGSFAIFRFLKGPLVGPPLLEVTEQELIWNSFIYLPTKTQKNRLESIKALKISGPRGDRRFNLVLVDGSEQEFRPYYGLSTERKAIQFLKDSLPNNVQIIEEEPPGVLSKLRGDF